MDEKEYFCQNTDLLESDLKDGEDDSLKENIELNLDKADIVDDSYTVEEIEKKDDNSRTLAIIAFVFSLISIFLGTFFSIISITMAIVSKTTNKENDCISNKYANASLIICACSFLLRILFIMLYTFLIFSIISI